MTGEDHERGLAELVVIAKRQRYAEQLASGKHRAKFLHALSHFRDWDDRYVIPIGTGSNSSAIIALLREHGAGESCWVISEHRPFDRRSLGLEEAVMLVHARSYGSIVSCIPGRLAYFEDEVPEARCILYRQV